MRGWLLAIVLVGCTSSDPPAPAIDRGEAPPTEAPDEPRAPRGAEEARCDGASNDPPDLERFDPEGPADLPGKISGLEAVVGAHPSSATARVRLGELFLRYGPPRASTAQTWFDRALALHEEGCSLAERDLWAGLEGAALSRMMQGEYAAARPILERSLRRWPSVPATRYNLACAQCQTDDLDGCAESLEAVLRAADGPAFLTGQQHPPGHYRDLAQRDPDLAPLREDGARFSAVLGADG